MKEGNFPSWTIRRITRYASFMTGEDQVSNIVLVWTKHLCMLWPTASRAGRHNYGLRGARLWCNVVKKQFDALSSGDHLDPEWTNQRWSWQGKTPWEDLRKDILTWTRLKRNSSSSRKCHMITNHYLWNVFPAHLAVSPMFLSPCGHDKHVVHRDAGHLLHTFAPELFSVSHESREMRLSHTNSHVDVCVCVCACRMFYTLQYINHDHKCWGFSGVTK